MGECGKGRTGGEEGRKRKGKGIVGGRVREEGKQKAGR